MYGNAIPFKNDDTEDRPTVTVSLHLFGKPAHELGDDGIAVSSQQVRDLAADLHKRLIAAADALAKLEADGWDAQMEVFGIVLCHDRSRGQKAVARAGA
jgi:hypothetical protein